MRSFSACLAEHPEELKDWLLREKCEQSRLAKIEEWAAWYLDVDAILGRDLVVGHFHLTSPVLDLGVVTWRSFGSLPIGAGVETVEATDYKWKRRESTSPVLADVKLVPEENAIIAQRSSDGAFALEDEIVVVVDLFPRTTRAECEDENESLLELKVSSISSIYRVRGESDLSIADLLLAHRRIFQNASRVEDVDGHGGTVNRHVFALREYRDTVSEARKKGRNKRFRC